MYIHIQLDAARKFSKGVVPTLHLHQWCMRALVAPHPFQLLPLLIFFILAFMGICSGIALWFN